MLPNQTSYISTSIRYYLLLVLLFGLPAIRSSAQITDADIASRIIVIGDAGKLHDGKNAVTDAVRQYIPEGDKKTSIVFAGDNIYPRGLPDPEDKNYSTQAHILTTLLNPFENDALKVYVIPGNHDWQKSGPDGWATIKRQEQLVKSLQAPNIIFLPSGGCPGPEEVPLSDSVVMVLMDTQWWLHAGEKPGAASDCDCKTEDEVLAKLYDIAYRNRNKRLVFIAHHALRSHGEHGGYYTWKQHLFPFTDLNKNAYIPLPVLGSLYPLVRGKFGNVEDLPHPIYKDMVRGIEQAFETVPDITYVGGHDHNLQLIREHNRNYIVSGSGTNRDRVTKKANTLFASDANGFTEIIYTNSGRQLIRYYEVNGNGKAALVYSYETPYIPLNEQDNHSLPEPIPGDSITVAVAPEYDKPGAVHRLFFGEHYRKIWATPVTMSIFRIHQEMGGLRILKKGGGQQTKSLRLEDKSGKQWVLRTIQKNPEKALPANLKTTVAKPVVQDQISASNPFASVTVPVLATAAGVPHSEPRLVYIPDDTALGIYRKDFAHTVCVFEEREPGGADETYSTQKVLEKLESDNDNSVDQRAVLRARMLDLLIGDWDRHEDQWRWIKTDNGKKNSYSPVPRDRDQVYFISTGILPYIAGRSWIMPKFQGFGARIQNVNGFMYNARYFDRMFLNALDEQDWEQVISQLQQDISDEVIHKAISRLPDTIYKQIGPKLERDLVARRKRLMPEGLKYYRFLAKYIDIAASDKKELVSVHNNRHSTSITLQKIRKDGTPGDTVYQRTVAKSSNRELRLYGRGGADAFIVTGDTKPGMRIRMIGGGGSDSFSIADHAGSKSRLIIYDRSDKDNSYPASHTARLNLSDKNSINDYNPRSFKYDRLAPLATAGFNLDDGLLLGFGGVYTRQGFRREPFASRHRLMAGRALATDAAFFRYKGDVNQVFGKAGLDMYLNVHAPDNTTNFFGIGNETSYEKISDPDIRYYRTRYNFIDAQVRVKLPVNKHFNVFAGVVGQYYNMDESDNTGRFIMLYESAHTNQALFDQKAFAGAVAGYEIDTRNDLLLPVRGFHWQTSVTGMQQLDHNNTYAQVQTEMSVYLSFNRYPKIVFADRIGSGFSIGTPEFFQMFYLGGDKGLLGYRKNRFAGTSIAYNNLEVRVKLFDFASYLFPGTLGLTGFNDIGRVWSTDENSGKWHVGYGGGLYLVPASSLVVTAVAGCSEEGILPYVTLGFRF